MNQKLNTLYPFLYQDRSIRWKITAFVFGFVFFFLSIFQPFHLNLVVGVNVYAAALVYGAVSALTALFSVIMLIRLFPNFANEKTWTIGKELLLMLAVLMSISIANFFAGFIIELHPRSVSIGQQFLDDVLHTFAIGVFPVLTITFVNYTLLLKRNLTKVEEHNIGFKNRVEIQDEPQKVSIQSSTKNSEFEIDLNHLLYVMADGNYVEFHFMLNDQLKREIIRNTLNNIEEQLSEHQNMFRSHRAFIVNLNKIKECSGNAQGYLLSLENVDDQIPVSRGKLAEFDLIFLNVDNVVEHYPA